MKQVFKHVRFIGDVLVIIQTVVCLVKLFNDYIKPHLTQKHGGTTEEASATEPTSDPTEEVAPETESAHETIINEQQWQDWGTSDSTWRGGSPDKGNKKSNGVMG